MTIYLVDSLSKITAHSAQWLADNNGGLPTVWGRYLGEIDDPELDVLAANNIALMAIARRSSSVCGDESHGTIDGVADRTAFLSLKARCEARGVALLSRLFLDVEMKPNLTPNYWRGWADTLRVDGDAHLTGILPCAYMPNRNNWPASWTALEFGNCISKCYGVWVALYDQPTNGSAHFFEHQWTRGPLGPKPESGIEYLAWQHTGNAHTDTIWVDYSQPNPAATWLQEVAT